MSTEGAWGTKSFWTAKTGVVAGAIALAVALLPAVARGEAVTPHAVTPHVVTPHVVSPPPADPAPSPDPAPSSEAAPSPEPAPAPSPSAAENPLPAGSPAPAPDPQGGQSSAPGGPTASDDCSPFRPCIPQEDEWRRYPDSVTYFVFTRLVCPLWIAIVNADEKAVQDGQDVDDFSLANSQEFGNGLERARQMSRRYCITSVVP